MGAIIINPNIITDHRIPFNDGILNIGQDGNRINSVVLSGGIDYETAFEISKNGTKKYEVNASDDFIGAHGVSIGFRNNLDSSDLNIITLDANDKAVFGGANETILKAAGANQFELNSSGNLVAVGTQTIGEVADRIDTIYVDTLNANTIIGGGGGTFPMNNDTWATWNQSGAGTVNVLKVDTNDDTILNALTAKKVSVQINEVEALRIDPTIMARNDVWYGARNNAGGGDLNILKADTSDNTLINAPTGGKISVQINETEHMFFDATALRASLNNTYDIGDATNNFNEVHSTKIISNTTLNIEADSSTSALNFRTSGTTRFRYGEANSGATGDKYFRPQTDNQIDLGFFGARWKRGLFVELRADRLIADSGASFLDVKSNLTNGYISLAGRSTVASQSAIIEVYSATHATEPGNILLNTPTGIVSNIRNILKGSATSQFTVEDATKAVFTVDQSGSILFENTNQELRHNTADASDTKVIYLCAGGSVAYPHNDTRGAQLYLGGADTAAPYAHLSAPTQISLFTNSTERLRLTSSGHTIPVADATYDLGADGTNEFANIFAANLKSNGTLSILTTSASGDLELGVNGSTQWRLQVSDAALVPITTNLYDLASSTLRIKTPYSVNDLNFTSDRRVKSDIEDITPDFGLGKVLSLRPRSFMKDDRFQYGFIAQEVYEHLPEVVTVGCDSKSSKAVNFKPWGMSTAGIIPHLVAAIQGLQSQINELKLRS